MKASSVFECQHCGYASAKWLGRCPDCGSWNSFVEEKRGGSSVVSLINRKDVKVTRLMEVSTEEAPRFPTGNTEFDRVLGGGIVPGSLILLGGEPGAGKSTLLLQIAHNLQTLGERILYISGEESARQIRLRADRLEVVPATGSAETKGDIFIVAESNFEGIISAIEEHKPSAVVVDSVQTTFSETLDSAPGSIRQVRYVAGQFLNLAKSHNLPVF
ncbi:MAG: ATPase domain-containing protein, partial [Acidobacteriota bacterium]